MGLTFFISFFFDPAKINVGENTSASCGTSDSSYLDFLRVTAPSWAQFYCYGNAAADTFVQSWQNHVATKLRKEDFNDTVVGLLNQTFTINPSYDSYQEMNIRDNSPYYGRMADSPPPGTVPDSSLNSWNALVPIKWLRNQNKSVQVLREAAKLGLIEGNHLLGGNIAKTDDNLNAVSKPQREAGLQMPVTGRIQPERRVEETLRASIFGRDDGTVPKGDKFVGDTEFNHAIINSTGPLKSDWTKPCPYTDAQWEKRETECFSLQEAVWGSDKLQELENIKRKVDTRHCSDVMAVLGTRIFLMEITLSLWLCRCKSHHSCS